MKEQRIYEVLIAEKTEKLHEGSGVLSGIDRKMLFDGKVSAVTARSAEAKAKKKIEGDYDEDSLEVKVDVVNFPG